MTLTPTELLVSSRLRQAINAEIDRIGPGFVVPSFALPNLQSIGERFHPHSYLNTSDDTAAVQGIMAYLVGWYRREPAEAERLILAFAQSTGHGIILGAARWANQAYPLIQYGHRYAAALMTTSIPECDINPPWRCFIIDVPNGLLRARGREGVRYLMIQQIIEPDDRKTWTLTGFSGSNEGIFFLCGHTTEEMRARIFEADEDPMLGGTTEQGYDDRIPLLLARLAMNTCLSFSEAREVGKPSGWHRPSHRTARYPTVRRFELTKPVKINAAPVIREYLEGEGHVGASITRQFLVRGHWRNQPCGVNSADRRMMWIEPYWKGPEDSIISVRPHVITGAQDEAVS
jgi:hypothetical protein